MTLALLSEKLLAAKGGDREIDDLLAAYFYPNEFRIVDGDLEINTGYEDEDGSPVWRHPDIYAEDAFPERYTADLSAAVALVEAKLPDHAWAVGSTGPWACIWSPQGFIIASNNRETATPALALLCAFIAAMGEKT